MVQTRQYDLLIVGAGVVGLTIAHRYLDRFPNSRIVILEKEPDIALHGSGRNSGVLHSGIYYADTSFKARFCREGNLKLKEFVKERNLAINECGKLVVAANAKELEGLHEIARRAEKNGCVFKMVTEAEARELEPNVRTYKEALFAPETASIDPRQVCTALQECLTQRGVEFLFDTSYVGGRDGEVESSRGTIQCAMMINCAGLYADKIAHDFGLGSDFTLLPFKGIYLKYSKNRTDVRRHLYPVPDLRFPFLGVHFTLTVDGTIKIGPTAMPAFWRENYEGFSNFQLSEAFEILAQQSRLFVLNNFNFRDLAFEEMRKYQRSYLIELAQRMVQSIDPKGFTEYSTPGIRAQLLNKRTRELVQDFVIERTPQSIHVLNAVSPGFTCSFPFADHVLDNYL